MKLVRQQKGLSTIMFIIIVGLFGYAIYIGLKITPVYMEYFSIKTAVDGIAEEMKTRQMSRAQYIELMKRRLDVNYVDYGTLKPSRDGCEKSKNDVFYFKTIKKDTEIGVNYEKRIPMIANIDFLVTFDYKKSTSTLRQ